MAPSSVRNVEAFAGTDEIVEHTARATTLADLISTIPQTWRPALGQKLTAAFRVSTKLCTVQNTIAQYERHTAERSFPPSIVNSAKDPKIQFSKEFLGTENGRLAKGTISAALLTVRKQLLASALTLKKEELAELQQLVAFDKQAWEKCLVEVAERVSVSFNATVEEKAGGEYDWKNAPAHAVSELKALWDHGSALHYRATALARSIADRSLVEKTRNLSLKKETDQEMKDADSELTTREVARAELKSEMAALEKRLAGLISASKKSGPKPKAKAAKGKGTGSNAVRQNGVAKKGGKKKKAKR